MEYVGLIMFGSGLGCLLVWAYLKYKVSRGIDPNKSWRQNKEEGRV